MSDGFRSKQNLSLRNDQTIEDFGDNSMDKWESKSTLTFDGQHNEERLKEEHIIQINRILFMNLEQFERESKAILSNFVDGGMVHLSERDQKSGSSINPDQYIHQKYPSFLEEEDIFSEKFQSTSSSIEGQTDAELSSSPVVHPPKISPLVLLYESRPIIPNSSNFFVVKLSNISEDTTMEDIDQFVYPIALIHGHRPPHFTETVHFVFETKADPKALKCGSVFIEFPTEELAKELLAKIKSQPVLRKRMIISSMTCQKVLLDSLFRKFKIETSKSDIENGHIYVSKNEIAELIRICRKKIDSSRAYINLERAARTIISILSKVPWHFPELLSTLQRDHLFELSKLSIEAIVNHPSKIRALYLENLVLATLCVPLFTEKQKSMILTSAAMQIPRDMLLYVYISDENLCLHKTNSACSCIRSQPEENLEEINSKTNQEIAWLRSENEEIYRKYQNCLYVIEEMQIEYNTLLEKHKTICQLKSNHSRFFSENNSTYQLQTPPQSAKSSYSFFPKEY